MFAPGYGANIGQHWRSVKYCIIAKIYNCMKIQYSPANPICKRHSGGFNEKIKPQRSD
jgi:hypothetical protein